MFVLLVGVQEHHRDFVDTLIEEIGDRLPYVVFGLRQGEQFVPFDVDPFADIPDPVPRSERFGVLTCRRSEYENPV